MVQHGRDSLALLFDTYSETVLLSLRMSSDCCRVYWFAKGGYRYVSHSTVLAPTTPFQGLSHATRLLLLRNFQPSGFRRQVPEA